MAENKVAAETPAEDPEHRSPPGLLDVLLRVDVLSGLLFIGVGLLGLYLSRNYDLGTAANMGTAYMPRVCCFALIGLGTAILISGLIQRRAGRIGDGQPISWRSLILVPTAVFSFGFTVERIGLALAILLAVGIAGTAAAGQKPINVAIAAVFLVLLCVAIFVRGLDLPFSIWIPDN